jgi:hypothetical protein
MLFKIFAESSVKAFKLLPQEKGFFYNRIFKISTEFFFAGMFHGLGFLPPVVSRKLSL